MRCGLLGFFAAFLSRKYARREALAKIFDAGSSLRSYCKAITVFVLL